MPALSFSVFRDKILSGAKLQTIRTVRKNPIKTGDKLHLYWKQQSPKDCEKLGEATCVRVSPITIYKDDYFVTLANKERENIDDPCDLNKFAITDGFKDWNDLIQYIEKSYGLPFEGVLIQWGGIDATN